MGGTDVPADLSNAKLKRDALRDSLEQFHERSSSLLYLSLQWKDLEDHYNAVQEALDRKAEELRLREVSLREIYRDVEAKQEEFRFLEEMIEDRCKDLDVQADDLGEKYRLAVEEKGREIEREIERRLEEIEAKEKKFESRSFSVQRLVDERFRAVEGKEKQLVWREREFRRQCEQFAEKSRGLEAERVNLNERFREVKLREENFEGRLREFELEVLQFELDREKLSERLKEVESKDQQAEERLRDLDSKNRELEVRSGEIEAEKERLRLDVGKLSEQLKAVELKEKQVEERAKELELKNKELEVRLEELESDKRKFESDWKILDELLREVELRARQSNERAKELELESKQLEVGWGELDVSRRMFEVERCKLNEQQGELESNRREFNSDRQKLDEQLREFDLKAKQLEGQKEELESSRKGFEEQVEKFKLMEKKLDERSRDVELKSKQWEEKFHSIQDPKLRGSVAVDGKNLQVLLNYCRKDHEKIRDELSFLLKISQDPSKVVLDALQGFFPPHLKKGDVEFKGSTVRASCILLLEQLMKISPDIKQEIKSEATKLSFDWMTKLRPDREHFSQILGFLLVVAIYKLRSSFDDNELLNYAKVILHWRQVPELCRMLGFGDVIPGFIQDLLGRKEHLSAIRFASTFNLLSEFPPDPIMKEFMDMSRSAFKAIFNNTNSSPEAQTQATNKRIGDLKAAIRCIEDHKLKLGYCPANIRQAIVSLEKQLSERRKAAAVVEVGVKLQGVHDENDVVHSSPRIFLPVPSSKPVFANCSVAETAAAIVTPDMPLQQKQNMKHSQTGVSQQDLPSSSADSDNCVHGGVHDENDMVHISPRISLPVLSSLPISANCLVAEKAAATVTPDMPLQQKQNMKYSQTALSQQAIPSAPADSDNCAKSSANESKQQICLPTSSQDHLFKGNVIEDVRSTSPRNGPAELQNSSVNVDGADLRSLLRGDMEEKLVHSKVVNLLESSSKPADLVFYALLDLHSSSSEIDAPVKGSILLLKELKRFSYTLNPHLHAKATKFALVYKSSLKTVKNNYMGLIFLLQLLDAYKVPHDADEVTCLLDPSIWRREVPDSCKLLGLQDFIPNFIKSLIQKNQRLKAIKYIHAMELESSFSVVAILKNHLAHWETKAEDLLKGRNIKLPVEIKALDMKLNAARDAIKCISTCKLASTYPTQYFEEYIEKLEKQKSDKVQELVKSNEAKCVLGSKRALSECCHEERDAGPASSTVASSTSESNANSNAQSSWPKKRKTKLIGFSDPGFAPPPPPHKCYRKKPWFHNKWRRPFTESCSRGRGRAQFLDPMEDSGPFQPYFTDIAHQGGYF